MFVCVRVHPACAQCTIKRCPLASSWHLSSSTQSSSTTTASSARSRRVTIPSPLADVKQRTVQANVPPLKFSRIAPKQQKFYVLRTTPPLPPHRLYNPTHRDVFCRKQVCTGPISNATMAQQTIFTLHRPKTATKTPIQWPASVNTRVGPAQIQMGPWAVTVGRETTSLAFAGGQCVMLVPVIFVMRRPTRVDTAYQAGFPSLLLSQVLTGVFTMGCRRVQIRARGY